MQDVLTFFYYIVAKLTEFLFDIEIFGMKVGTFLIVISIFNIIVGSILSYMIRGSRRIDSSIRSDRLNNHNPGSRKGA